MSTIELRLADGLGHRKVVPWTRDRVLAVREELPARYQLMIWLG